MKHFPRSQDSEKHCYFFLSIIVQVLVQANLISQISNSIQWSNTDIYKQRQRCHSFHYKMLVCVPGTIQNSEERLDPNNILADGLSFCLDGQSLHAVRIPLKPFKNYNQSENSFHCLLEAWCPLLQGCPLRWTCQQTQTR